MPVYEYACKACGHEFEREQRISDKPVRKCPSCGALQAKRLISRTSFVLKGGGWYSDLYATPKSSGAKGDGDGASASSDAASGSGSEGKGEAKDKGAGAGKKKDAGGKGRSGKGAKAAA